VARGEPTTCLVVGGDHGRARRQIVKPLVDNDQGSPRESRVSVAGVPSGCPRQVRQRIDPLVAEDLDATVLQRSIELRSSSEASSSETPAMRATSAIVAILPNGGAKRFARQWPGRAGLRPVRAHEARPNGLGGPGPGPSARRARATSTPLPARSLKPGLPAAIARLNGRTPHLPSRARPRTVDSSSGDRIAGFDIQCTSLTCTTLWSTLIPIATIVAARDAVGAGPLGGHSRVLRRATLPGSACDGGRLAGSLRPGNARPGTMHTSHPKHAAVHDDQAGIARPGPRPQSKTPTPDQGHRRDE
jgi:hypothetical protein